MIVVVGGALITLILWIWRRLQKNVDAMPKVVSDSVKALHDELLKKMDTMTAMHKEQMSEMNKTHRELERDIRNSLTELDRRLVAVEIRCDINHAAANGKKEIAS